MNTSEGYVLQEEKQEVENPVINQNDQMGPVMAMLNQLQQQLVSAQAEITALKNKEAAYSGVTEYVVENNNTWTRGRRHYYLAIE